MGDNKWVGIVGAFAVGLMMAYLTFGFTTGERLARLETKVDMLMRDRNVASGVVMDDRSN